MNSFIQYKFLNIVYGAAQNLIAIPALEVLYSVTFASYCRKDGKSCCSEKQPTNQIRTSACNLVQICHEVGKAWMLFFCYPVSLHAWILAKEAFHLVFFNWLHIASSGNFLSVLIRTVLRKFPAWFLHSIEDVSCISGKNDLFFSLLLWLQKRQSHYRQGNW